MEFDLLFLQEMGTVEGYIVVGSHRDVKYYYRPTTEKWTPFFKELTMGDIKEEKIEVDMNEHPMMDKEYTHEKILLESTPGYKK